MTVKCLEELTNLKQLVLEENESELTPQIIEDISKAKASRIDLTNNQFENNTIDISLFENVWDLRLNENQLTTIKGLDSIPKLDKLYLEGNKLGGEERTEDEIMKFATSLNEASHTTEQKRANIYDIYLKDNGFTEEQKEIIRRDNLNPNRIHFD